MDSLDIFDTAIFRDVYEPTDIFKLLEIQFGPGFYNKRIQAEERVRQKGGFYTLKDIYSYLPGLDRQKEIDMELNHVYANKEILEKYNKHPKSFVFISDMYLPSDVLVKILEKCGYKNPRVFVSCEMKANKGSGLLFEKVQKQVGKITKHYGDNYKSDIQGCIKQNITPVFKQALHKQQLDLPMVKNTLLKKYCANLLTQEEPILDKLCKWYAPLIYSFTKWVLESRQDNQQIFFLSRDMFMPYLIATILLRDNHSHYLYCSRRSLAPLYIESKEKPLVDKMKIVLTPEEYSRKQKQGIYECISYLKQAGIKNGDIIVDIGYSGSTQRVIEKFLNIKLKGMYMQLDQVPTLQAKMDMKMFLKRFCLIYRFLAEFILTGPEDNVEDYINGEVITTPDNEQRKQYAKHINSIIVNRELYDTIMNMNPTLFDIEQMLIHIQNYPTKEIMELFNEPILTNRRKLERGVNFDKQAILNGKLLECYKASYARPWFKKMLQEDKDLNSLIKLLPDW